MVIVGAGVAGVTAAGTLRDAGYSGRITLVETESTAPYDRPPLSKDVLLRDGAENAVSLRPPEWYAEKNITLASGNSVTALHPAEHRLQLSNGNTLSYDKLLLAMGSRVRSLPSLEQGRVPCFYLRTLEDSLRLREQLAEGRRVVMVGGGVIGMEVAASALRRGCKVAVVEQAPRIMSRALCEAMSTHLANYHLAKGVDLYVGTGVVGQSFPPAVPGLQLADGRSIAADVLVIGIGVVANDELARAAGIRCDDGIVVDEHGATSAADVFAAGDVARYPDSFCDRTLRGESWMHAQNQAAAVAKNMLGAASPYRQVPYVWSDQYDLKIQIAGVANGTAQVVRGKVEANAFIVFHLRGPRIVGAVGINSPRDMSIAQRLMQAGREVAPERLQDPAFNLMSATR